jgi:hypothetical protein
MPTTRALSLVAVASIFGVLLLDGGMATAASKTPVAGTVRIFETPGQNGTGSVVITGAIGDYGTVVGDTSNGKNPNDYSKVTLKQGTFEVNQTAFYAKLSKAAFSILQSSCSSEGSATGRATVFDGTGLYAGISGTVSLTETQAWILPRGSNGKCNGMNPSTYYSSITGMGSVRF